jgi:MbtH protein
MEDQMFEDDDDREYVVVINDEEQYSIWPADRAAPDGWREDGCRGTKAECLAHISEVWVDMRPRSLRLKMEQAESP